MKTLPLIVEVIRRTEQGITRPYLCRADDGTEYFVKHRALPARQRVAEWLAAHLARELGLPVPPFSLVRIPDEFDARPELKDLGAGIGFGSEVQLAREFTVSDIGRVDASLAARIAAFDWWVRNSDRSLTALGGNPNLLWRTSEKRSGLVVIDHNLAFDPEFSAAAFSSTHVFASQFNDMVSDFIERERVRAAFCHAKRILGALWTNIPSGWRFSDVERTIQAPWSPGDFESVLARCENADQFWTE